MRLQPGADTERVPGRVEQDDQAALPPEAPGQRQLGISGTDVLVTVRADLTAGRAQPGPPGVGSGSAARSTTRSAPARPRATSRAFGSSTAATQARAASGDLPYATCRATSRSRRTASSSSRYQTSVRASR